MLRLLLVAGLALVLLAGFVHADCADDGDTCNATMPCCGNMKCSSSTGNGVCLFSAGPNLANGSECGSYGPVPNPCKYSPEIVCRPINWLYSDEECLSCVPENTGNWLDNQCYFDTQCCPGLHCGWHMPGSWAYCIPPNRPPAKPAAPAISADPLLPPSSTAHNGKINCTANCPPSPLPVDPDGDSVNMSYLWYKDGTAIGSKQTVSPLLDCSKTDCGSGGSTITLVSIACDIHGDCNLSDPSNAITVIADRAPAAPPVPVISPQSASKDATFSCIKNCPPSQIPPDPDGDTVSMSYQWYLNGAQAGSAGYGSFDCTANGCAEGDTLSLHAKACDQLGACNETISAEASVTGAAPPQAGTVNLSYTAMALIIAIAVIALAYMASYVFSLPQIRAIVQDELLQVIATGVVALSLLGVQAAMDGYGVRMLAGSNAAVTCSDWNNPSTCSTRLIPAAQNTLESLAANASSMMDGLAGPDGASRALGQEASKGVFCNFLGVGFTLVNCSQLNAFRGSLTIASFAAMSALADIYAQQFLLSLIYYSGFAFILPLGLFMRCFKVSRRAGGALIAIGFGFYTVFPAVIVATENLLHGSNPSTPQGVPKVDKCDPKDTDAGATLSQFVNYGTELTSFDLAYNLTYFVLVRVIFMSILNLIITLGFIRAFAHIIGSDIDVSALARIS